MKQLLGEKCPAIDIVKDRLAARMVEAFSR
jgi:hypothetical protein